MITIYEHEVLSFSNRDWIIILIKRTLNLNAASFMFYTYMNSKRMHEIEAIIFSL